MAPPIKTAGRGLMRYSTTVFVVFAIWINLFSTTGNAQENVAGRESSHARYDEELAGSTLLGTGALTAYRKVDRFLLELRSEQFGRLALWHAEAVEMPTQAEGDNTVGTTVVSLQRNGSRVLILDRAPGFQKRPGRPVSEPGGTGSAPRPEDEGVEPIQGAIAGNTSPPIIASLPIVAEGPDGRLLVDVTKLFSNDIESLSAKRQVEFSNMQVKAFDPDRSFIKEFRVFPQNLSIRSQITFLATDRNGESSEPVPITVGVGHWLVPLPENPMPARVFDNRVGFFETKFTEFESSGGATYSRRGVIWRHRLEKLDPSAVVSEPVEPIVFYVGRGVPQRWRPYVRAGIELWQPVFEAAGFRNAIIARNAPSPEEDPNWSADDARRNVVRWLPTDVHNAIGPTIYDPRSGEIIGAHVQIFPRVVPWFSRYYYLLANGLDPDVKGLPLSEEKLGEILTYIVAHEVGHALGLRHNHLASTAYSVADLRNPAFANLRGPNASIMAYGRLNQAAQPGDGVTRVLAGLGPYDYFAVKWGYGVHGSTPAEEQAELDRLATAAAADPLLRWAAGEAPDEDRWKTDPRVLKENVGRERVEATRLGIAKLVHSVAGLTSATEDSRLLNETYDLALSQHRNFISSLGTLIGGTMIEPGGKINPPELEEQRNAIRYALGEGTQSLDVFIQPDLVARTHPVGALRRIAEARASIVTTFLNARSLAAIEEQARVRRVNYALIDYADDVTDAIWNDLSVVPAWRQDQQNAYVRAVEGLLRPIDTAAQKAEKEKLTAMGYSEDFALHAVTAGRDTSFPAWAGEALPKLISRLAVAVAGAQDRQTRLHLAQMAVRLGASVESGTQVRSGSIAVRAKAATGSVKSP
jgi:hypothetical protein